MSKKKKQTKLITSPPKSMLQPATTEPPIPDETRQQVVTWLLEGKTVFAIQQQCREDYPTHNPTRLISAALDHIATEATTPPIPIDQWCVEAAKLIYERQIEIGDFSAALRTVAHINTLAQKHAKPDLLEVPSPTATMGSTNARPSDTGLDLASSQNAITAATQNPTLIDPNHQSRDARLINRAIKQGWEIPEHIRQSLPAEMAHILTTATNNGDKISAGKVLVTMMGQNIRAKPPTKRHKHEHRVDATPITEANFDERKRQLSERLAGIGDDTR
ncbi:MAG: hypothetical protein WCH39_08465 [Schlesneria sp.]